MFVYIGPENPTWELSGQLSILLSIFLQDMQILNKFIPKRNFRMLHFARQTHERKQT